MKRVCLLLALLSLLAGGCMSSGEKTPRWERITYSRSGGIAGFDQQLTIGTDGSYNIIDRGRKTVSGKLPGAELKALRERVAAVQWAQMAPKYINPEIADAIFEGVAIDIDAHSYTTLVGTGGAPPAELRQLLQLLMQIATRP
ncbi:MAG TPA: hypothetical protein VGK74_04845 [Symbiobacteriaceae bacterium]